jgi:hypothetical protein
MKNLILLLVSIVISHLSMAQGTLDMEYLDAMDKGDSLLTAKNYKAAARTYTDAPDGGVRNASRTKHIKAARAWALAGNADSAFFNLYNMRYPYHDQVVADTAFVSLRDDPRWQPIVDFMKNYQAKYPKFNEQIALKADSIATENNRYRMRLAGYIAKFGIDSPQTVALRKKIAKQDTATLRATTAFLDKYGWVGRDVIGEWENCMLLLQYLIDYGDLKTQEKYLPILKEGAKDKPKLGAALAPLIDKVELAHNRPQIYGTQGFMKDGNKYEYYPILDEAKADKLRAELGFESLDVNKRRMQGEYIPPPPPRPKGGNSLDE